MNKHAAYATGITTLPCCRFCPGLAANKPFACYPSHHKNALLARAPVSGRYISLQSVGVRSDTRRSAY